MRARRSDPLEQHTHLLPLATMRSTAFISTLALLAVAAVNPVVARPGGEPSLVARAPSPSLVARAPSPSLAARAPAPSGSFTKRALRQKPLSPEEAVAQQLCPGTMRACPIDAQSSPATLLEWIQEGFECVDPQEDLTSCGGCGTTDIK